MTPMSARELLETDVPLGVLMQARLAAARRTAARRPGLWTVGPAGGALWTATPTGERAMVRPGESRAGPSAEVLQEGQEAVPQAAEPSLLLLPADAAVEVVELLEDSVLVAVAVDPASLAPPAGSVAEEPLLRESVR